MILRENERLTRLINQVLDLAKIESGAAEWSTTEVDVGALIADAVTASGGMAQEKGVRIEIDAARPLHIWVVRQRKWATVHVSDNGQGISAEDQQVIFEEFRQGGDRSAGRPPGTGLGLPISAQIVAHFGGRLRVESRPGKGATFAFTLPLNPDGRK